MAVPGRIWLRNVMSRRFLWLRSLSAAVGMAIAVSGCAVLSVGAVGGVDAAAVQATPITPLPPAADTSGDGEVRSVAAERRADLGGGVFMGAFDRGFPPAVQAEFIIDPAEVHPRAKQVAGSIAVALTTYATGESSSDLAYRIVSSPTQGAALSAAAAPLVHAGMWSRGRVVYPQLGGMRTDRCSVMVVVEQSVGIGEHVEFVETRTLDIRLVKDGDDWVLDHLASAGGTRLTRPDDLPTAAATVLDDPRIQLPDSARWDIYRGHTSERLLELMSDLADRMPFGVVVLASGHPHNVFATDRTSNHTIGKAVDVYLLGETRVIDDRTSGSHTYETVAWLYDHPSLRMVGSPWALDGAGGASFTDVVHQDHLHISVRG